LRIRPANVADVPAMIALERDASAAAHWSRDRYEAIFVEAKFVEGTFVAAGAERQPARFAWVVEREREDSESLSGEGILAFLVAHRISAEWELENIVVAEPARRQGIGALLLSELIAHARAENAAAIFLEVRASNHQARALYRNAGFLETGLRESYYANPPEDAILCSLGLY
jgi:ribosomal-protein-alanine acetyltransferase